ncbi:MAG TPA: winged helix-turn-helix domain-containing protein [Candidatus Acidoferrales bacterium]
MPGNAPRVRFRFADFELDPAELSLSKAGRKLHVQEKPLQLLHALVAAAGSLVTRDVLRAALWPADTFVDFDRNVNTAVRKLRDVLGDSADQPRFIETVPRHGYRFIAAVERIEAHENHAPPPAHLLTNAGGSWRHNVATGALAALMILASLAATGDFYRNQPACPEVVRLAVLPLRDITQDAGAKHDDMVHVFSAGLTEEVATLLGRSAGGRVGVLSTLATAKYRCTEKSLREIGDDLGANYVLTGTVRRVGGRVRVTTQLVRTSDQTQIVSESFEHSLDDVLLAQSELARQITLASVRCLVGPPEQPQRIIASASVATTQN